MIKPCLGQIRWWRPGDTSFTFRTSLLKGKCDTKSVLKRERPVSPGETPSSELGLNDFRIRGRIVRFGGN